MSHPTGFTSTPPTPLADIVGAEQVMEIGIRPLWSSMPRGGKTLRFRRDRVATTPFARQVSGFAAAGQVSQPTEALRRFTLVRDHDASMASSRHALAEAPQRMTKPHWDRPVNSGPRPCLFDVGFPLSGLQDRAHTSDLKRHARHASAQRVEEASEPRLGE